MTTAECTAVRLVIDAMRMMLKAYYRESESGNTGNRAMAKLDEADELLKQGDTP